MRLGGWWRLWIGLSAFWVLVVGAFALFAIDRPTQESEAKTVGIVCDLDMPITPALAPKVLEVPGLVAQLAGLEDDAARKPVIQRITANVGAVAANAGKGANYGVNLVNTPEGEKVIVVAPTHYTDTQVFEQADKDRYKLNTWAKFDGYCERQLQAQARDELYPKHLRGWVLGALAGVLSFPLASLLLGLFIGWVWRGFRLTRAATLKDSNNGI